MMSLNQQFEVLFFCVIVMNQHVDVEESVWEHLMPKQNKYWLIMVCAYLSINMFESLVWLTGK